MLAFEAATPRFDGTLTLSRPAGAVLASGRPWCSRPWRLTSKVKAGCVGRDAGRVAFSTGRRSGRWRSPVQASSSSARSRSCRACCRRGRSTRSAAGPPDAPRRLPLAAVQAFGEMLGSALRPPWPVKLALNVDAMTLGGAPMQNVASDLDLTAPPGRSTARASRAGFTQVKVDGRLYPLGKGLGFAGGASRLQRSQEPGGLACRSKPTRRRVQALARQG